jgi:hypothetical protein
MLEWIRPKGSPRRSIERSSKMKSLGNTIKTMVEDAFLTLQEAKANLIWSIKNNDDIHSLSKKYNHARIHHYEYSNIYYQYLKGPAERNASDIYELIEDKLVVAPSSFDGGNEEALYRMQAYAELLKVVRRYIK